MAGTCGLMNREARRFGIFRSNRDEGVGEEEKKREIERFRRSFLQEQGFNASLPRPRNAGAAGDTVYDVVATSLYGGLVERSVKFKIRQYPTVYPCNV